MDVQSLIDRAGSVGKLAAMLEVSHTTICEWKRNGFIPGTRVAQISLALRIGPEWLLPLVKPPRGAVAAVRKRRAA